METYSKNLDVVTRSGDKEPKKYYFQRTTADENRVMGEKMKAKGLVPCFRRTPENRMVVSFEPENDCVCIHKIIRGFSAYVPKTDC